jgi:hypothetical protein
MAISLTCSCSAVLEVDERFAGQTVICPDCRKPLTVPVPAVAAPGRTSGFAIASLVLALVGAFTVVGTILAIVCGAVALWTIRQHPKQLAGQRIAWAGMILGAVLSVTSLLAYISMDLFGVDGLLREARWLGKLDYPADLEIKRSHYKIKRPTTRWGVLYTQPTGTSSYPSSPQDMLLVLPAKSAYIICLAVDVKAGLGFEECQDEGIKALRQLEMTRFTLYRNPNVEVPLERHNKRLEDRFDRAGKVTHIMKMKINKMLRGEKKTYFLRIFKQDDDLPFGDNTIYVVAGVAPSIRLEDGPYKDDDLRKELHEALDSFSIFE